ncbi:hypothetical protein QQ008_15775 [Fulvivirgaceae bacterium BMA10]|uniref:Uncharacterized protein n=1 Tax=Splendidivirga corallicola TaxID=3051826 RepID=A0ABT8KQ28_9BACT|nr:hypothetical protein [Fulvivirgaceae bacterium BMA10]
MANKDELFSLIQSLTKSEKRHFKLFASLYGGDKNHLRLFEAIDKQVRTGKYDERLIYEEFSNEAFCKQLHVTKNYLVKLILKSLRNFHQKISIGAQLKDQLREIEILYNKGLYKHCAKLIKKAEALAEKFDKSTALLELLHWKRNLIIAEHGSYAGGTLLEPILQKESEQLRLLCALHESWEDSIEIIKTNMNNPFGRNGVQQVLSRPDKNEISEPPNQMGSYQVIRMKYFIKYLNSLFLNNINSTYSIAKSYVTFLEKNPHQIQEEPLTYVAAINNLVPVCLRLRHYDEVITLIQRAKAVPVQYKLSHFNTLQYRLLVRTYNHELELYRDLGDIPKGINLIQEVSSFINTYDTLVTSDYRIVFYYQFAYFLFADGKYSEALIYVNQIMSNRDSMRKDLLTYTRILNLMLHYEMKNYDLIEYLYYSTKRFINKQNQLYEFEKLILEFFKQISETNNANARERFILLKEKIKTLEARSESSLDYINIIAWIQSKLNRTTFAQVLKQNQKKVE